MAGGGAAFAQMPGLPRTAVTLIGCRPSSRPTSWSRWRPRRWCLWPDGPAAPWACAQLRCGMPSLNDVVDLLHGWYPPHAADDWDAVGLVHGDPAAEVAKVMFAVDPAPEVADEAARWGADLLVVHHPLFLKPVHGFAATTPKGRTLATLAARGLRAADRAHQRRPGRRRGLRGPGARAGHHRRAPLLGRRRRRARQAGRLRPGRPTPTPSAGRWPTRAPDRIGDYDHASFSAPGRGPVPAARGRQPARSATVGRVEVGRRGAGRGGASRGGAGPRAWPRCWRRTPTRSRRTTWSSWPTRARPPPAPAGSATVTETTLAAFAARGGRGAARDRARRPCGRRPGPDRTPGGGVRRRRRLPARHGCSAAAPTST